MSRIIIPYRHDKKTGDKGIRSRKMLDFEEELKKFKPCLEVDNIKEAVYKEDLTDITDIMKEMIENVK